MFIINPEISVKKIADEIFMYNRQQSLIHSFNETGALILESIQEQKNIEQICQKVVSQYEIDPHEAQEDILQFLEALLQQNIIQNVP